MGQGEYLHFFSPIVIQLDEIFKEEVNFREIVLGGR